jgi:hypothetical protein
MFRRHSRGKLPGDDAVIERPQGGTCIAGVQHEEEGGGAQPGPARRHNEADRVTRPCPRRPPAFGRRAAQPTTS